MARYILIDNCSGYIFGDTADYGYGIAKAQRDLLGPVEAARELDQDVVGEYGRSYEECGRHELASDETGYHVYRADVGGSDAVPVFENGQDTQNVRAVERDCEYVTTIRCVKEAV